MIKINILFLVLLVVSIAVGQVPTNGLIAWYTFNDSIKTGNITTTIKDSSTNNNNGTAYASGANIPGVPNIISSSPTLPNYSHVLSLNGASCVTVTNFINPKVTNDSISISLWYYKGSSDTTSEQLLIGTQYYKNNYYQIQICEKDSINGFSNIYGGYNGSPYTKVTPKNKNYAWHHVVLVVGIPVTLFYVDNKLIDSVNTTNIKNIAGGSLLIGAVNMSNPSNSYLYYKGYIGNVRVYNRVLQFSEISNLYAECHVTSIALRENNVATLSEKIYYKNSYYDLAGRSIQTKRWMPRGIYIAVKNNPQKMLIK